MVTCWERDDLLALVGDVYCVFVTFPCCILGQVWYLIVLFPDLCCLSYLDITHLSQTFVAMTSVNWEKKFLLVSNNVSGCWKTRVNKVKKHVQR